MARNASAGNPSASKKRPQAKSALASATATSTWAPRGRGAGSVATQEGPPPTGLPCLAQGGIDYIEVYQSAPDARIRLIKAGVPARNVDAVAAAMGLSREEFIRHTGLSRPTILRRIKDNKPLDQVSSERVVAMSKLIGQVQNMVSTAGDPSHFDAARWLARWLQEPNTALNQQMPGTYLDTSEGLELIATLLDRMLSGAYA